MEKNSNVPQIRFKGFTDAWEQVKLSDIAEIVKGKQINKIDTVSSGKYKVLNGGTDIFGYTNSYNSDENTISISEGGSCGYTRFVEEKFWSGGHNYTLKNVLINPYFLFTYLKKTEKQLNSLGIGLGVKNIQLNKLKNFEVYYSKSILEQDQVSSFFKVLDNLITLHQRKCERLKHLKQAYLEKMFPKNGEEGDTSDTLGNKEIMKFLGGD